VYSTALDNGQTLSNKALFTPFETSQHPKPRPEIVCEVTFAQPVKNSALACSVFATENRYVSPEVSTSDDRLLTTGAYQ